MAGSSAAGAVKASVARPDFIELPVRDVRPAKAFYEAAFGWALTDFGASYASTMTGDVDVALQADPLERPSAPLVVIQVADLEDARDSVERAGGTIVAPIFAFPGGRRFHFRDPAGNELAAHTPD